MEITILGAGLAGLTAAVHLAKRGNRVRLFEKRSEPGGRALSNSTPQGFTFNLGPHALYRNGTTIATLRDWGMEPAGGVPNLDKNGYFIREGTRYPMPLGLASLATSRLLSTMEKIEFGRAYQKLATQATTVSSGVTVRRWLDDNFTRPAPRALMSAFLTLATYCSDFDHLAMDAAMEQFRTGAGGVIYVDGGWQTIIDSLLRLAWDSGVEVRLGETTRDIGPNMILAVPPDEVEAITGQHLPPCVPLRMACLDIGLASVPDRALPFALSLDKPLYLSMHSYWAKLAPEGKTIVQVGQYLKPGESGSRATLEAHCDQAVPGWRNVCEFSRFLPEMVVTHAAPGIHGRPAVDVLGEDKPLIAGDWVGSEFMLADAAVASGLAAASRIMARDLQAAAA